MGFVMPNANGGSANVDDFHAFRSVRNKIIAVSLGTR